jgi:hypothetical protein
LPSVLVQKGIWRGKDLTKEIGMLCVGVGFVGGSAHVPSFRKAEGSKLVGIAVKLDVPKGKESEDYAKKQQEKYGIEVFYDYNEALKDSRINGVCIAVPTPFHYVYAEAAIKAGKHVYLEMPVAPTVAEIKKLKEMAAKAGVTVMPILNFRFTPNYSKAKELFDQLRTSQPSGHLPHGLGTLTRLAAIQTSRFRYGVLICSDGSSTLTLKKQYGIHTIWTSKGLIISEGIRQSASSNSRMVLWVQYRWVQV